MPAFSITSTTSYAATAAAAEATPPAQASEAKEPPPIFRVHGRTSDRRLDAAAANRVPEELEVAYRRIRDAQTAVENLRKKLTTIEKNPTYSDNGEFRRPMARSSQDLGVSAGDLNEHFHNVSELNDIKDGSFDINGTTINVSVHDSIDDIVDDINSSGEPVTAQYDLSTGRFLIVADDEEVGFVLSNDTADFFSTLFIAEGDYERRPFTEKDSPGETLRRRPNDITPELRELDRTLSALLEDIDSDDEDESARIVKQVRGDIGGGARLTYSRRNLPNTETRLQSAFGAGADLEDTLDRFTVNVESFQRRLESAPNDTFDFLASLSSASPGLVKQLESGLAALEEQFRGEIGSRGGLVSLLA